LARKFDAIGIYKGKTERFAHLFRYSSNCQTDGGVLEIGYHWLGKKGTFLVTAVCSIGGEGGVGLPGHGGRGEERISVRMCVTKRMLRRRERSRQDSCNPISTRGGHCSLKRNPQHELKGLPASRICWFGDGRDLYFSN